MFFQLFLLHFIFLLLQPTSSTLTISTPGCPSLCGNVSIPYPFGVGPKCSLDPSFEIKCDKSTDPPRAYLSIADEEREVIEINATYIRVKYPNLVSVCYDLSEYRHGNATSEAPKTHTLVNVTGTRFTLSEENQLIALGCDDMAVGVAQSDGSWRTGGCSAFCADENHAGGGIGYCGADYITSINNGCCQATISEGPADTGFLGIKLINMAGILPRRKLFSCSHATIREVSNTSEAAFSYPLYYLNNATALLNDNQAPIPGFSVVRLGWVVGSENCSRTEFDSTANACQDSKSVCIDEADDYSIRKGYLCRCAEGYEGNPYLPGGCKPISSSISSAKSGCLEQCGKISIPFPFGVGPNCYLEPSFEIVCSTTTNPPTATLHALNLEIIELNSTKVVVWLSSITSNCYNLLDGTTETKNGSLIIDLSQTQYTVSDDNEITAIGCNGIVVVVTGKGNRSSIRNSCSLICSDGRNDVTRGFCSFIDTEGHLSSSDDGCCKASIPKGTIYVEANFTDLSGLWPPSNISCSYAFPRYVDRSKSNPLYLAYDFLDNKTALDVYSRNVYQNNLALDWRIGAVNCKEARLDPASFACKDNSDCIDYNATVGLGGYLCNCSQGYQGNPYIYQGCRDIDECTDNPCDSNAECRNTPGSYMCSCRKGYYADKSTNGRETCIPSKLMVNVFIGLGSGVGFLLLLTICILLHKALQKRRNKIRREKFFKRNGGLLLQQQTNEGTIEKTKLFCAEELQKATDNFNHSRILGQGGQGTVYKGMLPDGKIVAIKKSKVVDESQLNQFINEVVILSHINHKNIIKLWGCCLETEVPLLVYEFIPNGNLYDLIHAPNNKLSFPWRMRLKIAADIAGALTYLHTSSSIPVYHRDIKSSNFLLDEKYVVKVADFGISKFVAEDQTHLTTMVKGTFGYFDPEYFRSHQYTDKSDVYSFGVVLAELLTGKKPIYREAFEEMEISLATHFLTSMEENNLEVILDPEVAEHNRKEEVMVVARLAQRCLNWERIMRPTMKEACTELESLRISEMPRTVEDEANDVRVYDRSYTVIADTQYAWTGTASSTTKSSTTSSDIHPFLIENA